MRWGLIEPPNDIYFPKIATTTTRRNRVFLYRYVRYVLLGGPLEKTRFCMYGSTTVVVVFIRPDQLVVVGRNNTPF